MKTSKQNVRNNELKTNRLKVSPFVTGFIPRWSHVGTAMSSLHKARQENTTVAPFYAPIYYSSSYNFEDYKNIMKKL